MADETSTMVINSLDAHDRPPEFIKGVYKKYQKLTFESIQSDPAILDFCQGLSCEQQCKVRHVGSVSLSSIDTACSHLRLGEVHKSAASGVDVQVYESKDVPGEP